VAVRTLVVWCPDWPVLATALAPELPVAVLAQGRVLACSGPARAEGVAVGLRRRQAESCCPGLVVVDHDPDRDARAFEPVVAAVESFAPRVEVTRPGSCAVATRGPSRYFGGEQALVTRVAEAVEGALGRPRSCRVGIADGPFAAGLAARRELVVPPGASAAFLAPLPAATLGTVMEAAPCPNGVPAPCPNGVPAPCPNGEVVPLVDLWGRLGIRTLGELAALPAPSVLARFGPDGARAHRLARGLDERLLATRTPPPDLAVSAELDPPVEAVETAAFVAKSLADQLCARLDERGLALTCALVETQTEHGEGRSRLWRHPGGLGAAALAQRVRWQVEGWLEGRAGEERPTAGITLLRLVPEEVGPDRGRQLGFWGGQGAGAERAARGLARLQGMLGRDAVVTAVVAGGRSPAERARLVPWGDDREGLPAPTGEKPPWPGGLPPPAPATVPPRPRAAEVIDAGGSPIGVTGRGRPTAVPARLSVDGGPWAEVAAWAGPWPLDERWWDPRAHRRRARWQLVTTAGDAHLLSTEDGRWLVEATYD
jgi:protein ImuB